MSSSMSSSATLPRWQLDVWFANKRRGPWEIRGRRNLEVSSSRTSSTLFWTQAPCIHVLHIHIRRLTTYRCKIKQVRFENVSLKIRGSWKEHRTPWTMYLTAHCGDMVLCITPPLLKHHLCTQAPWEAQGNSHVSISGKQEKGFPWTAAWNSRWVYKLYPTCFSSSDGVQKLNTEVTRKDVIRAGEMAVWLRVLTAILEDLGWVLALVSGGSSFL